MMIFNSLRHSLRAKVTLGVVIPLVLILGLFTALEYSRHRTVVLKNLSILASHSGKIIESNLHHAMLESDFDEVQALLDAIGDNEDVRVVYLMDTSGTVIFSPNHEGVGTRLDNTQPDCQPCHQLAVDARPDSVVVEVGGGQRVFRSMHTIENAPECAQCHASDERLLGLLLTDISMQPLEASLSADLRANLIWSAGTVLVSVLIVNLAVSRFVLQRLEGLAHAITDFGQGRLPSPQADWHPDEIGQLTAAFDAMARQVEARSKENRQLSESLRRQSAQRGELLKRVITAQEDERKRVARELHDELGQSLGGLALRAEAMERMIRDDPSRALEELHRTRTLITETTDRMYELIMALRPSALDDLGLAAALRVYVEQLFSGTGVTCDLDVEQLTDRLPSEVETAVYRLSQEALNNVLKHAQAQTVHVTLAQRNGMFEAEIVDDGRGFEPDRIKPDGQSPRGLGLLGMQERVTQFGGELDIQSQPGGGTCIRIHLPLSGEHHRE